MGVRTAHGTNLGATSGPSGAMGADTSYEVRLDRFAVLCRSRSIDARNLRPYVFHRDAAARFPCARGVAPRPLPCDSRRPTLTSPRPASRLADADGAQPGAPQGETGLLPAKDRLSRRLTGGGRGASPPFPDCSSRPPEISTAFHQGAHRLSSLPASGAPGPRGCRDPRRRLHAHGDRVQRGSRQLLRRPAQGTHRPPDGTNRSFLSTPHAIITATRHYHGKGAVQKVLTVCLCDRNRASPPFGP